jgi:ATP-dependent RNA helicase RhlB
MDEGKRRRRRGGRGRRRTGAAPGAEVAASQVTASAGNNSRPSRQVVAQSPSGEQPAPRRQGFFRRLVNLFTRR